jgi:hypothetical protein
MTSHQGDLALLQEPIAQQLLQSTSPARLAYVWTDGTPRLVPVGFHWTGSELFFGTQPDSPKNKALHDGAWATASIDTDSMPYRVLQVRGRIHTDIVDGVAPEYEKLVMRMMGAEGGRAWLDTMRPMTPRMARFFPTPEWVGLLDFETRFPNALERAMEGAAP